MKGFDGDRLGLRTISMRLIIALTIASIIIPFTPFSYLNYVFMYFFAFSLLAASWDLLYSYSGQLSLGQALPFGVGAFSVAILSSNFHLNPIISLVIAPFVAAAIGGAIGGSTIRLRPAYQGIALLLFSQVLYWLALFQFGDEGISFGFVNGVEILSETQTYAIGILAFLFGVLTIFYIEHSNLRLKLLAIKQDNLAALAGGINVRQYKVILMFVSSFVAGLGGGFLALYTFHTDFTIFQVSNSFLPISMAVVGGMGSIWGALIGSLLISLLTTILPTFTTLAITYLIYGLMVILVLRFFPEGLRGIIRRLRK
ncbi:MAG: branched-chain amino acid ABC transporter permease [Thaumarchaeota archaeon]|nr:branched-chain amino acid ABC transporter permease [Nitrososphaerota archaeon]MDG7041178.1 branched-chain amino acid ABC transporter permease [Nitrososphaerota archaeon]MDG7043634.1 branched-chain amino acid ABC transporter permease [Nitrososphaerota archaeon]